MPVSLSKFFKFEEMKDMHYARTFGQQQSIDKVSYFSFSENCMLKATIICKCNFEENRLTETGNHLAKVCLRMLDFQKNDLKHNLLKNVSN